MPDPFGAGDVFDVIRKDLGTFPTVNVLHLGVVIRKLSQQQNWIKLVGFYLSQPELGHWPFFQGTERFHVEVSRVA